jgi:protein O-GlcNAc transferase
MTPQALQQIFDQAVVAHANGQWNLAEQGYRQVLAHLPDQAVVWDRLGVLESQQGKHDLALQSLSQAIAIEPTNARSFCNIATVLAASGRKDQAIAAGRQAIQLDPMNAEFHFNLGLILVQYDDWQTSEYSFRRAIELQPTFVEPQLQLASIYHRQGRYFEAIQRLRSAHSLKPGVCLTSLIDLQQQTCTWTDLESLSMAAIASVDEPTNSSPLIPPFLFMTLSCPTTSSQQRRCAHRWSMQSNFERIRQHRLNTRKPRSMVPHSKLRIGYLSGDFDAHATAWLIAHALESHDRNQFDVVGYSYGPPEDSPIRRRIIEACDQFRELSTVSDYEIASTIQRDEIDILVDLKGYTLGARPEIACYRPAPIQIQYLGYPGTMGGDFIDYLICDEFVVPASQAPFYSEKLVYLPGCYQANDGRLPLPIEPASRMEHGLPEEAFVFCCFNRLYKITPHMLDVWSRLIQRTPSSVLWLLESNSTASHNLRYEWSQRGLSQDRLIFAPKLSLIKHLARHRCADLFLDSFPVNAHTTASDAIRMGLPMITLTGDAFVSRVAGSLLHTLGMDELIATNFDQYEARALQLANDRPLLDAIATKLRRAVEQSSVFDGLSMAKNLERAYTLIWGLYQSGDVTSASSTRTT